MDTRDLLFATMDAGGHAAPALSVARGLLARGHSVRMLADPTLEGEVEAAGVEFVPWRQAPHRRPGDPVPTADEAARTTPLQDFAKARDELICGPAAAFAADLRTEVARRRPDCVVGDLMLVGVAVGAEAEGLPMATLAMTFTQMPGIGAPPAGRGLQPLGGPLGRLRDALGYGVATRLWGKGLPAVNAARVANGLEPLAGVWEQLRRPERTLVLTSPALEFPGVRLPAGWEMTGARVDDPAWAQPWKEPTGTGPLVLVSLSSDQMGQLPVLERIVAGLGALDARVVVTTGPNVDPADLPAPAGVTVVRSAPHVAVMRAADAVVTHGGHGTVAKALALGVPVVCTPLGRDQFDIAARVEFAGAGIAVRASSRPRAFARAVERVLTDPTYREAAGRMGLAMAADRGSDRAVDRLEALAASERQISVDSGYITAR